MKRIYFIYIIILAFVFSSANAQLEKQAAQLDILMKMQTLRSALLTKDSVALSTLLSDDVTYGHTNGWVQTKSELIRSVMSGEQDYKTIEPSDMNVRLYDATGIVTMNAQIKMQFRGKPLDLKMRILLVWVRQNEMWKLVARQSVNYE